MFTAQLNRLHFSLAQPGEEAYSQPTLIPTDSAAECNAC